MILNKVWKKKKKVEKNEVRWKQTGCEHCGAEKEKLKKA